ncbi:MAG: glycerophosphoryl diester phosphodiesterase membrane domain-containing protein [Candidatus Nanoarchaeia archaeon]
MGFGEIFKESWKDYGKNFRLNLKANIYFYFLVGLAVLILTYVLFPGAIQEALESQRLASNLISENNMDVFSINSTSYASNYFDYLSGVQKSLYFLFLVISLIFSLMLSVIVIYFSVYSKDGKMSFSYAFRNSIKYLGRYVGITLMYILFVILGLIGLGLIILINLGLWNSSITSIKVLLVIFDILFAIAIFLFAIYAGVRLYFSYYAAFMENKGVIDSIKKSWSISKGKFWKIFGNLLLFFLIVICMLIALSAVFFILGIAMSPFVKDQFSLGYNFAMDILNLISSTIYSILIGTLTVIFSKNLYSSLVSQNKLVSQVKPLTESKKTKKVSASKKRK